MLALHLKKRIGLSAGIFLLAALSLAGCGSKKGGLEEGKNVLRVSFGGTMESLDPVYVTGAWDRDQVQSLFDNLFVRDNTGKNVPSLAESYTVSSDLKTWTIHLRKATLSDGSPLTADDVVFSFQRVLDPKVASSFSFILQDVKNSADVVKGKKPVSSLGLKVLDSRTVEIKLSHSVPYFRELLAHHTASIVPKKTVEAYGKKWTRKGNVISSGAYVLEEFVPKDHLTLRKNPNFWDAANVNVDKVIFYPIDDSDVAVRRYKAGELDFISYYVSAEAALEMRKTRPEEVSVTPYLAIEYVLMTVTNEKFADPRVREALSLAIDRQKIVDEVEQGLTKVSLSFTAPGIPGYTQAKLKGFEGTTYEGRLKKAQDLMRAAGYSEDKPLEIVYSINNSPIVKKRAVAIMDFWSNIFVKASLLSQDVATHYADVAADKFEIARGGWSGGYADPTTFLLMFKSLDSMQRMRQKAPDFDKNFEASYLEKDPQKRMVLLHNAEQAILDTGYLIPLLTPVHIELHSPVITNFKSTLTTDFLIRFFKVSR